MNSVNTSVKCDTNGNRDLRILLLQYVCIKAIGINVISRATIYRQQYKTEQRSAWTEMLASSTGFLTMMRRRVKRKKSVGNKGPGKRPKVWSSDEDDEEEDNEVDAKDDVDPSGSRSRGNDDEPGAAGGGGLTA